MENMILERIKLTIDYIQLKVYLNKNYKNKKIWIKIYMNIFRLLNNNIEDLNEEERVLAENFNEALREKLIDDLAEYEIDEFIKELKSDEESFRLKISEILVNGKKGYIKMPTKTLIDIYLDKKDEGEFINLIESISSM